MRNQESGEPKFRIHNSELKKRILNESARLGCMVRESMEQMRRWNAHMTRGRCSGMRDWSGELVRMTRFQRSPARTNACAGLYPAKRNIAPAHNLLSHKAEYRFFAIARNNA